MGRPYDRKLYKRNRKTILATHPPCSYPDCTQLATTADHIIPTSKGGSSDLSNLRPMCLSHNSSRGNRVNTRYTAQW